MKQPIGAGILRYVEVLKQFPATQYMHSKIL
jgi:hypothetical protein